ncbi:tetratricopeptide repeat protein [Polyangium aurulentum]|nr:tetratricopeptide repeat protein [Polyangium aurulentum]
MLAAAREKQAAAPDPLAALEPKKLALRLGIPLLLVWIIAFAISGWIPKAVAAAVTLALAGLVIWVLRTVKKTRAVADIIRTADTPEARKEALSKLETQFDKDDPAAVFARAQIELQEGDPRKALATLETIRLEKVMPPVADEARAQRAMIHLVLGETDEAKALCEKVDLSRHKEPKSRATIAAIVGEAWARSGQAKKAVELLETIDPNDATYADLKPQLLRSRAFAYAWANDTKKMKQVLRTLQSINAQYLASFITKKKMPGGVPPKGVHPLLEKEAFEMITRSGMVPRKMEYRRG